MRRTWRWSSAAGGATALLLVVLVPGGAPTRLAATATPGCVSSRPALTFDGQGTVLAPSATVVPCLSTTGYGGAETRVVVVPDGSPAGTLVYEPAIVTPGLAGTGFGAGLPGPRPSTQVSPGGLAVSRDQATTWRFVEPAGQTWVPQDDQLYADRTTGWLYYYALSPDPLPQGGTPLVDQLPAGYAQLMASPDGGRTWYHSALPGYIESENPRFASAPAPGDQQAPGPYAADPDVLYWCGNNMLFSWAANEATAPVAGVQPVPSYRACYRSFDGGVTWAFASVLFSTPVPQHSLCGRAGEDFSAGDSNYPQGAPDGSLYVLVTCAGKTYLARSTDEGATWPVMTDATGAPLMVPADGELRVDPNGVLYLVALRGDALDLWTSADRGAHWHGPADMTVPGSSSVGEWSMAEAGGGEVAVSYLATSASGTGLHGFLTVTRDALDASPVFVGAPLDDPTAPVYAGTPAQARDDFIGVDIGPDGTPWASFFGSCSATDPDPACVGQGGNPEANKAYIGHLAGLGPLP